VIRRNTQPVSVVLLNRIYAEAKRAVMPPSSGVGYHRNPSTDSQVLGNQSALRRVHVEFHKRLKKAGIYVEGAS
jgi:hypothetical protein